MKPQALTRAAGPVRVVHLLRHGQYRLDPSAAKGGPLTPLGRKQALLAGEHLRRWPIARIWSSDLLRACETAEIVRTRLRVGPVRQSARLREIVPTAVPGQRVPLAVRRHAQQTLEALLQRFFIPTRVLRHELLVCHGNLIRALVCRVLGGRPGSWLLLATYHCALTTIMISPDRQLRLVRYGENGFLPDELLTHE